MNYTVVDHDNERTFPNLSEGKANERASGIKMMIDNPSEVEIVEGVYEEYSDCEDQHSDDGEPVNAEVVDMTDGGETVPKDPGTPAAKASDPKQGQAVKPDVKETSSKPDPDLVLHEDPIAYLKSINNDFVNRISGKPAISKQGFRYIQVTLGINTTSEVVETFDDPLGVVVHARAELPDGRYAEAHGEGYQFESGVDDNEFVRYADTRAKNRCISDLTSSGALAESEMQ